MLKTVSVVLVVISLQGLWPSTKKVEGKINKVVLYRDQAQVTRVTKVNLKKGFHEIVFKNLPAKFINGSLYAQSQNASIRSVLIKKRELENDATKEVRSSKIKIEKYQDEVSQVNAEEKSLTSKKEFLKKMENFIMPTAKLELLKGTVNLEAIQKLTEYKYKQTLLVEKGLIKLNAKKRTLARKISFEKRKLNQLNRSGKIIRDAIVYLEKSSNGSSKISLNYMVNNASWKPVYNFRANSKHKKVEIEFNADIYQNTGERWNKISLVLSNASPAISALGPGISPFWLTLTRNRNRISASGITSQTKSINQKFRNAYKKKMGSFSAQDSISSNWEMNEVINQFQNLELMANKDNLKIISNNSTSVAATPNAKFSLKGKIDILNRNTSQLARVRKVYMKSKFYRVATPILSTYVFREAEMENNKLEILLAGQVHAYLNNNFVGKAQLGDVVRGQKFIMGFGVDSQIRTKRVLTKKSTKVLGGNKEMKFNYQLKFENFSKNKIALRVFDRVPVYQKENQVRFRLNLKGYPLSTDKVYLENERNKGILRWDISLKGKSRNIKSHKIKYGYSLEFDKNLHVGSPTVKLKRKFRDEFEQMQKTRMHYR